MGERLAVHDLVESAEVDPSEIAEREITAEMQDAFLNNDKTAKITYNVQANNTKSIFTITLGNLNGIRTIIEFEGTHDTLGIINDYILRKAQQPEVEIILPTDEINTNIGPTFQGELDEIISTITN